MEEEKVAVDENPDITITEVTKGEPITGVAPCTECVDKVAREVLSELIEMLADEVNLDDNYGYLLEKLNTGVVSKEQEQPN